jgi:hypothetical protein
MKTAQIGSTFSKWTIIDGPIYKGTKNNKYWVCRCECGTVKEVAHYSLYKGKTHSCGCATVTTEKTKKLLSKLRRARTTSPIQKGFKHSEEAKEKMRLAQQNRREQEKAAKEIV